LAAPLVKTVVPVIGRGKRRYNDMINKATRPAAGPIARNHTTYDEQLDIACLKFNMDLAHD